MAPTDADPARIPLTDESGTGVQVPPPSMDRARTLVASVLLPATQIPLEYPIELQTGKGADASGAAAETTLQIPASVAEGRDAAAKTFPPLPPTIQSGAPVPCDPPRPYATESADVVNGVNVEKTVWYTRVYTVPVTVSVPWTMAGVRLNGGYAGWVAVMVVVPAEMSLMDRILFPMMSATAGLLVEKNAPVMSSL